MFTKTFLLQLMKNNPPDQFIARVKNAVFKYNFIHEYLQTSSPTDERLDINFEIK